MVSLLALKLALQTCHRDELERTHAALEGDFLGFKKVMNKMIVKARGAQGENIGE